MKKETILFVDDQEEALSNFEKMFQDKYNVEKAVSSDDALKLLKNKQIKVCIIDLRLNEIADGTDLTKVIKHEYKDGVEIIVYTGKEDISTKEDILKAGALTYVHGAYFDEISLWIEIALYRLNENYYFPLNKLIGTRSHGIIGIDKDGKCIIWNKGATEIFQYTWKDVKEKVPDLMIFNREKRNAILKKIQSNGGIYTTTEEERCKDGTYIVIIYSIQIIESENDTTRQSLICVCENISEKIKIDKKVTQALQFYTVGAISTGLAHDIKGPINGIRASLNFIRNQKNIQFNDDTIKHFDIMQKNLANASSTINSLTGLARDFELPPQKTDIQDIFVNCKILLKDELMSIKLIDNIKYNSLPDIYVERSSIINVILNIVRNSIQAISDNGEIILEAERSENMVTFKIKDNGCGILSDVKEIIFKEIISTKPKDKGVGFGLFFSHILIEKNKGKINFYPNLPQGTIFEISLPIYKGG